MLIHVRELFFDLADRKLGEALPSPRGSATLRLYQPHLAPLLLNHVDGRIDS